MISNSNKLKRKAELLVRITSIIKKEVKMSEETTLQETIDEGPSDLYEASSEERSPVNKDEQHVVFFRSMRTVKHHMKYYPAFEVDQPGAASGIQWFWDKRASFIQTIMQRCYDQKKRCKVWVYYRYPAYDLNNQILGEAYKAEEYVEPT